MNIKQHLLDSTESIANLLPAVDGYATCYELSLTQEAGLQNPKLQGNLSFIVQNTDSLLSAFHRQGEVGMQVWVNTEDEDSMAFLEEHWEALTNQSILDLNCFKVSLVSVLQHNLAQALLSNGSIGLGWWSLSFSTQETPKLMAQYLTDNWEKYELTGKLPPATDLINKLVSENLSDFISFLKEQTTNATNPESV